MKNRTISRAVAAGLFLLSLSLNSTSASAGTVQYKFDSGICDNGKTWASVTCYIAGVFVWADGIDCDGNRYHRLGPCFEYHYRELSEDPTIGLTPTHTGETSVGSWRSVIVRDGSGVPLSVVGVGESGNYYAIECGTAGS